jgi:carbamoyl-phosphate synthase large subunit
VLPRLEPKGDGDYPCFVRLRHGSGGRSTARIDASDQLQARFCDAAREDLLIQSYCDDPEYTIDALFGPDGALVQWVVRERIRVRAGESVISRIVAIPAIDELVVTLAHSMQLFGPITLQAFYSETGGVHAIEVNPRIGGGAALGIEAGLATPERLVALTQGDVDAFQRLRPLQIGLTMLRYSKDLFIQTETTMP